VPHAVKVPHEGAALVSTGEILSGGHSWTTEEGPVLIEMQGDFVVIAESLDHEDRLPEAVLGRLYLPERSKNRFVVENCVSPYGFHARSPT